MIARTPIRDGEAYLTEAINVLATDGKPVFAYEFEARRYDIGDKGGYLEAVTDFALRDGALCEPYKKYLTQILKEK